MAEEGLKKTENERIHIGCPIPFDTEAFLQKLEGLMQAAYSNKSNMKELVMEVVNTYRPAELVNQSAAEAAEFAEEASARMQKEEAEAMASGGTTR